MQLFRPLKTRFRYGSKPLVLNLAAYHNSLVHSTKGTPSHFCALTACKHTVSGSISLPSRGSFHLSLTVLYAIGRQGVFRLTRWSWLIPTGFLVSRGTRDTNPLARLFTYRTFTSYGCTSQYIRLSLARFLSVPQPQPRKVGLGSSPFARRYLGNRFYFLFLRLLRCFSSPGCPP